MQAPRRIHLAVTCGAIVAAIALLLGWLGPPWAAGEEGAAPLAWSEVSRSASPPPRESVSEIEPLVLDVQDSGPSEPSAQGLLGSPGILGYPFSIHVVDALGAAVVGAEVEVGDEASNESGFAQSKSRLWRSLGRTAADGGLLVPAGSLRVERHLALRARAPGFLPAAVRVDVSDLHAVLVLQAPEVATVEVISTASGRAVAGAAVWLVLRHSEPSYEESVLLQTATDEAGRARIEAAFEPPLVLSVSAPGFQSQTVPVDLTERVQRITLTPARAVRVLVRTPDDRSVPGALVRVSCREKGSSVSAETNAEGEAWIDRVAPSSRLALISARHAKYGSVQIEVELSEALDVDEFVLRFEPVGGLLIAPLTDVANLQGFTVDVVLTKETGLPGKVFPEWIRTGIPLHRGEETLVEGLPVGVPLYVLCRWQRTTVALREAVVLEEGVVTSLQFEVPALSPVHVLIRGHPRQTVHGGLTFQARDGRTQRLFAGPFIPQLTEEPFRWSVTCFGDVVLGLPEGDYDVSFKSPAGCRITTSLRIAGPEVHEIVIDCGVQASFRSRLLMADGTPAAGQTLILSRGSREGARQRTRTDEDGAFEFDAVGEAEVRLSWVGGHGHGYVELAHGRLALEGATRYVLDACRVRGRVLPHDGGPPLRGVRIQAALIGEESAFRATIRSRFLTPNEPREFITRSDGTFELILSAGSWTLLADGGSGGQAIVKLDVAVENCPPLVDLMLISTEEVVFRRGSEASYLEVAVWDLAGPHPHEGKTWPLRVGQGELKLRLPVGPFRYSVVRREDPILSNLPGAKPSGVEAETLVSSTFVVLARAPNEILLP